jgi:hypothetical protein
MPRSTAERDVIGVIAVRRGRDRGADGEAEAECNQKRVESRPASEVSLPFPYHTPEATDAINPVQSIREPVPFELLGRRVSSRISLGQRADRICVRRSDNTDALRSQRAELTGSAPKLAYIRQPRTMVVHPA